MPLLRKAVLLPIQGLDWSKPSTLIDDRSGFPKNVYITKNEIVKRPGKTKYGSALVGSSDQIMGMGRLETNSGSTYLFRSSKSKIERYDPDDGSWDDKTGVDMTGGDNDLVQMVQATPDNVLIVTNFIDNVRKLGTGASADLGGTPPKAKYACYLSPYLLLAHTNDGVSVDPWKVAWDDTDDIENWSTGNAGSEVLTDEPSYIKNIVKLNEFAAVYKENSLWIGRKLTASTYVFDFTCMKTGIGLQASRCVVDYKGIHYFMGYNDFHAWNGVSEQSIGASVRDEVFTRMDRDKANRCFAFHAERYNEIWFFIVTVGNDWPTEVWKYNYNTGFWYMDTCSEITAMIMWQRSSTETWDDDVGGGGDDGSWDAATDVWDSGIDFTDHKQIIMGDSRGYSLLLDEANTDDDGSVVTGEFISKDLIADKFEYNKRWLQVDVWARGIGVLNVSYSIDEGNSWTSIGSLTLTGIADKQTLYFDVLSKKIRFRFFNNISGDKFYLQNFYPYYLDRSHK